MLQSLELWRLLRVESLLPADTPQAPGREKTCPHSGWRPPAGCWGRLPEDWSMRSCRTFPDALRLEATSSRRRRLCSRTRKKAIGFSWRLAWWRPSSAAFGASSLGLSTTRPGTARPSSAVHIVRRNSAVCAAARLSRSSSDAMDHAASPRFPLPHRATGAFHRRGWRAPLWSYIGYRFKRRNLPQDISRCGKA
jgi:hypothetical protein